jgi:hypothetical protein
MNKPLLNSSASFVRLLYTHNPFYLIGTLLVLVGLQQSLGKSDGTAAGDLATGGLLTASLAGYTLLLAAIAALIIGCGRIWDDARTILLVIVLMFFMLSASLDVRLNASPLSGSQLLVAGLAFSIGLSELLLRGLGIGLAWRYRGPYYLLLALLFAWPTIPAWLEAHGLREARSWSLFAFPAAAALALVTLLPAARTPAQREPATGTPWIWPLYPWSLFVYLTIGIALRSWWLTISFEPASGTAASFRPYFLLPLVPAWSLLLVEIGRTRNLSGALAAGMMLPLASLLLAFPGTPNSTVAAASLARLATAIGSPAQLALGGLVAYYFLMWIRRIPLAEGLIWTSLAGLSLVGPQTLDVASLTRPQPLPLACLAGLLIMTGVWRESTRRLVAGGTMIALGALTHAGPFGGDLWFWQLHAPIIALLALPVMMSDDLAHWLRDLAWRAVPGLALAAAVIYPWVLPNLAPATLPSYLGLLLFVSFGLWQRDRQVAPLVAAAMTLLANVLALGRHGYALLENTILAKGLPWLASGLAIVAVALGISLLKMGFWTWCQQTLARANLVLSGRLDDEREM